MSGVGLTSSLADGAWTTFRALLDGRTVSDRLAKLQPDTDPVALARGVGGVPSVRHTHGDPAVDLAERAAREAAHEARAGLRGLPVFLGASKGAVVALEKAEPLAVVLGPHGYLAHHLTRRTAAPVAGAFVAACASSLVALHAAATAVRTGRLAQAIVVSSEAALTPLFLHSYRRLGVLAPMNVEHYHERPLDERRAGFVLTEAGVAVMLERDDDEAPAAGTLELVSTATAAEAHDLLRPSPTMHALRHVALQLRDDTTPLVTLQPHAPGTADHDRTELSVLYDVFGHTPAVYAHKGALGHTLGASGLLSLVLAALMARTGRRPPMPWLDAPMPGPFALRRAGHDLPRTGDHAVFAAGFAGHVAGARLRRHA